jgi:hypothetical protein
MEDKAKEEEEDENMNNNNNNNNNALTCVALSHSKRPQTCSFFLFLVDYFMLIRELPQRDLLSISYYAA